MTVTILGMSLVNPSLNLRAMVKQISKNPARSKKIQEIDIIKRPTLDHRNLDQMVCFYSHYRDVIKKERALLSIRSSLPNAGRFYICSSC